jgi:hypothetical protein
VSLILSNAANPNISHFNNPSFSASVYSKATAYSPSLSMYLIGQSSTIFCPETTIPEACIPIPLNVPSSLIACSNSLASSP